MLAYTAGDGLQVLARTHGFPSTGYQPDATPRAHASQGYGVKIIRQALCRLFARR